MDQRSKSIGSVLLIAEIAWAVFEFVRALMMTDGQTVIGALSSPGVFFGLAVGGLAGLVMLNWSLMKRLSPRVRLGELAVDAENILTMLEGDNTFTGSGQTPKMKRPTEARLIALIYKLKKLQVPCPATSDVDGWCHFLPTLTAYLNVKNLTGVRESWNEVKAQRDAEIELRKEIVGQVFGPGRLSTRTKFGASSKS